MRIVAYDEIADPKDFLQLMQAAFWWMATPERVAEIRKLDRRYREPYGFGMYRGKQLIGFVGTMDLPVRTRDGKVETAVGIHHVATLPDAARQGISTRLFEHAHDYYRSKGCRFSLLFTSRSLVGWSLYRKLGYVDLPCPTRADLLLPMRKPAKAKNRPAGADLARVERFFTQAMANRSGLAARYQGWVRDRLKLWSLKPAVVFVDKDGYAFTEPEKNGVWVTEFLCRTRAAYERILGRIAAQGKRVLVDCGVYDPVLMEIYRRRGARFRSRHYGSLMAKPLTGATVQSVFGPRFYWTSVDQF